nr:MAG: hypothetical protein [Microviridae sp.]
MEITKNKDEKTQGVEPSKLAEKKIQITVEQLKELLRDALLAGHFVSTLAMNPEMKAPVAIQFARAMAKQTRINYKEEEKK